MKVKSLKLNNFAKYAEVSVSFDENVTYLVGNNGDGKSTLGVNAIWFMFQGIAEKASKGSSPLIAERFRFIGQSGKSASGEMVLHDDRVGDIKIVRKMTKDGTSVTFEGPKGHVFNQEWLNGLFNAFLIAPDTFLRLSGTEQALALGIDVASFDETIKNLKAEYTLINREIRGLGELVVVEPAKTVDVTALNHEKNAIIEFNREQQARTRELEQSHEKISGLEVQVGSIEAEIVNLEKKIADYRKQIDSVKNRIVAGKNYVKELPVPEPEKSTADVDAKINGAQKTNERAYAYERYLRDKKQRDAKTAELEDNKNRQAKTEAERNAYIKGFKLPFDNLSISEDGGLLLSGKPVREPYFSTGELLKIVPVLMSSLNPELKYVFIQKWDLMDAKTQAAVEENLVKAGFQLVIEKVGSSAVADKNCIVLKDMKVVTGEEQQNLL